MTRNPRGPGRPKTTWQQTTVVDPSDLQLIANRSSIWRFIEDNTQLESDQKAEEALQLTRLWYAAESPGILTDLQLQIFHLHYGEERLSLIHLARRLGSKQNTVAKHLEAITNRLKKALAPRKPNSPLDVSPLSNPQP